MTVAGARHDVPRPFHVLATQNPLEQEGTYPLPEAQLDRFLMEIDVDYPDREAERKHPVRHHRRRGSQGQGDDDGRRSACRRSGWCAALPVGESVVEAILALVRSARPGPEGGEAGKT